jgi:hypothetical protein
MRKVRIASSLVPVVDGVAAGTFASGEHGKREAGVYHFWTVICLERGAQAKVTGRALKFNDAGERFRRIGGEQKTARTAADRKAYRRLWKRLQCPLYVRPATAAEVGHWLMTHESDAVHLTALRFSKKSP